MPDGPTPKHPSDSNIPHDGREVSEGNVEQKLELAAELARELTGEIGSHPNADLLSDPLPDDHSLESIEKDLDEELNELQHLVETTQAEVGDGQSEVANESPEQSPSTSPLHENGPTRQAPSVVPDFMSEFTLPEPVSVPGEVSSDEAGNNEATDGIEGPAVPIPFEAAPAIDEPDPEKNQQSSEPESTRAAKSEGSPTKSNPPPSPVLSSRPGVVGTGSLSPPPGGSSGALGTLSNSSLSSSSPRDTAKSASSSRSAEDSDGSAALLFRICDRGVGVLERIDRPFSRFGSRLRYSTGMIAIALIGAAIVVFFYSLL